MTENRRCERVSIYDLEEEESRRTEPDSGEEVSAEQSDTETQAVIDRVLQKLDDSYYVDESKHRDFWKKLDELSENCDENDSPAARRSRRKQQRIDRKREKEARLEAMARVELYKLSQSKGIKIDTQDFAPEQAAGLDDMPDGVSYSFSDCDTLDTNQSEPDDAIASPLSISDGFEGNDLSIMEPADSSSSTDSLSAEDSVTSTIPVIEYDVEDGEPELIDDAMQTSEYYQQQYDEAYDEDYSLTYGIEDEDFYQSPPSSETESTIYYSTDAIKTISWKQYLHSMAAARNAGQESEYANNMAGDDRAYSDLTDIQGENDGLQRVGTEKETEQLKRLARRRAKTILRKENAQRRRDRRLARMDDTKSSIKGLTKVAKALLLSILIVSIVLSITAGILIKTEFFVVSEIVDQRNESSRSYQELLEQVNTAQSELDSLAADAEQLQLEISSYQDLIAMAQEYQLNKTTFEAELEGLRAQLDDINSAVANKQHELDEVKASLELYQKELAAAKGKGYKLSAGVFFVDEDIPHGYYNIDLVSGNGNVYVKTSDGTIVVGELFGTRSDIYISSYKNAYLEPGGYVEITGSAVVTFTARDEEDEF